MSDEPELKPKSRPYPPGKTGRKSRKYFRGQARQEFLAGNQHAFALSFKQRKVIEAYTDRGNIETYLNKAEAMRWAGYAVVTPHNIRKFFSNEIVRHSLDVAMNMNGIGLEVTRQQVIEMFKSQYDSAVEKGDTSNALRAAEAFARINGMFQDRLTVSDEQKTQIDESIKQEVKRISKLSVVSILDETTQVVEPIAQLPEPVQIDAE